MKRNHHSEFSEPRARGNDVIAIGALALGLCLGPATASAAPSDCSSYTDRSGAGDSRTLVWDFSITSNPARCMKVRVGQSVIWQGDVLGFHPLASDGGTTPNPIPGAPTSASATVTFTQPGTFGYICGNHAFMTGAIQVVAAGTPVPASTPRTPIGLAALLLGAGAFVLTCLRRGRSRLGS